MKRLFMTVAGSMMLSLLAGLDISVANLNPVDLWENRIDYDGMPDFTEHLIDAVSSYDQLNILHLTPTRERTPLRSLLDAGSLASGEGIDYLLYGSLFRERKWIEVRISLYERETDRVRTVFYGKAEPTRTDDMVRELADKICRYFYITYHIEPALIQTDWKGFSESRLFLGGRCLIPPWNERLNGTVSLGFNGTLTPDRPVFFRGDLTLFTGFGLFLGYSPGLNNRAYETFYLQSLQIAFPLELGCQWRDRHCFTLNLTVGEQIDVLTRTRLYGSVSTAFSQSVFVKGELIYTCLLPRTSWTLGLSQAVEVCFYDPIMLSYKPAITLGYRFPFTEDK